ncbi:MAG: ABC transporter permease [Deltaproteobacteria bacterium]|nr:ABC transporter permease [Deltaproteobacteria bacterium]MBW2052209.1 ABC transporter permease [Deltaproteobacteria bacterium]MBW2139502.1 ABC transporter permease [Deltaproteobacteria bacterium]MBW2322549.1 ABC transporter permease [Deltaproteobacteria bacterium]
MREYITRRIIYALIILALSTVLLFGMVRLLPGDPIRAAMQQNVDLTDESIVQEVRARYGLDKPVHIQFVLWLRDFVKGDWGTSLSSGEPVWDMFLRRLPVTLLLFVGATFWAWVIGIPLGIFSALNRNSYLDASFTGISIVGISIPVFWEAILLIYALAVIIKIFPPSGYVPFFTSPWQNFMCIVLPTFVMGTQSAGSFSRYIRSSLLEVLGQDYIRTARAKGLREKAVVWKHAAKPALIPVVTVIGLSWGHLIAGSFIVEFMFAIPGLGRMGVDAVFARDFPVLQATLILVVINVLFANLLVDILYGYLDPRVRVQK